MGRGHREDRGRKTLLIAGTAPAYRALAESYDKAQSVQKVGRETRLDRLEAAQAKKRSALGVAQDAEPGAAADRGRM